MYIEGLLRQEGLPTPENPIPIDEYFILKDNDIFTGKKITLAFYKKVRDEEEIKKLQELLGDDK